jgi:hypothetical protein
MATSNTKFKAENGLDVVGSANVSGTLRVEGDLAVGGNLAFTATVTGDLNPTSNNLYRLGNTTNAWASLNSNTINVTNVATIASLTLTNGTAANLVGNANNAKLGSDTGRWDFYANNANLISLSMGVVVANQTHLTLTGTANATLSVNTGSKVAILATGNSTYSNLSLNNDVTAIAGNVVFDTDLLFLDAVNNRVGIKNTSPSSSAVATVTGNVEFSVANTGLRLQTGNVAINASITLMANSSNSRVTFATYDNSNSSVQDGGYVFNISNTSTSNTVLNFSKYIIQYNSGNVAHAGNFGIYDVSGTRLGP